MEVKLKLPYDACWVGKGINHALGGPVSRHEKSTLPERFAQYVYCFGEMPDAHSVYQEIQGPLPHLFGNHGRRLNRSRSHRLILWFWKRGRLRHRYWVRLVYGRKRLCLGHPEHSPRIIDWDSE